MTPVNLNILAMELEGDPLGKGYSSLSDAEVEALLNAQDTPVVGSIDADFLRQRLVIMPCEAETGAEIYALALNYWRKLANTVPTGADLEDPVIVGRWKIANMLVATYDAQVPINLGVTEVAEIAQQAVQLGLLTSGQLTMLQTDATTMQSRAEILGIGRVTHENVAEARNNG